MAIIIVGRRPFPDFTAARLRGMLGVEGAIYQASYATRFHLPNLFLTLNRDQLIILTSVH